MNTPLKRTNPIKGIGVDSGWVEISWEEALSMTAEKLVKIRKEDPRKLLITTSVTDRELVRIMTKDAEKYGMSRLPLP